MNIFRLVGDLSHLLAIIILLQKIWHSRSCAGISGKSQILFAVVYTTRYLDLATAYVSLYNTIMKVVFLSASFATIHLIYIKFKATYDQNHDTFRIEFLLIPSLILSLLINHDFTFLEILWTFSIYLESVAILPQLFLVSKTGEAESITSHYLFALGSYRALYILNWIYRYMTENGHYDLIAIVAGIVQTILYCDFFYLYITKACKVKVSKNEDRYEYDMLKDKMEMQDTLINRLLDEIKALLKTGEEASSPRMKLVSNKLEEIRKEKKFIKTYFSVYKYLYLTCWILKDRLRKLRNITYIQEEIINALINEMGELEEANEDNKIAPTEQEMFKELDEASFLLKLPEDICPIHKV